MEGQMDFTTTEEPKEPETGDGDMEMDFKKLVLYLSNIALALFYLIYLPRTGMSAMFPVGDALVWLYYFTLVLGLMFPLYYALEREDMSWYVLGLALILNAIIMILGAANWPGAGDVVLPGVMILLLGVLFFIGPILEPRMPDNWDMIKNIFHILKGLFVILAVGFYAGFDLDLFIGDTSFNHAMPQFIFMGGGLFVAFGVILFMYGLLKLLSGFLGDKIGGYFMDLAKIFYMFMVFVFLLGILFNVVYYTLMNPWAYALTYPSINFFYNLGTLGGTNLAAILLLILFIYGMEQIAEKMEE
jgi:hypothetical protein